jgi:glycosyltransferase involved in cell wall biosynthesis
LYCVVNIIEFNFRKLADSMKICFVAQNIYPPLSGKKHIKQIGGAELQQIFIGKGLKSKGYDISYLTMDWGQPEGQIIEGLKIHKSFKPDEGLFGIRFFYPRLYKTWKALQRADADIYYLRCASYLVGILALFCRIHKKKLVFAGAHDTDFIPNLLRLPTKRDKLLHQYGLRRADAIITQSVGQKKLLWKYFRRKCRIVPNFFPCRIKHIIQSKRNLILWVSKIRSWKRPERFIRLATSYPEETFVMIGGEPFRNKSFFAKIQNEAKKIKNIQFLGFQPLEVTEDYFDRCKVFVNTSVYEGFPNTFLQAWRRGIPVISYVDPDNVIDRNKLGIVVNSENELHHALETVLSKPQWDQNLIFNYFQKNHSFEVIEQYMSLFDDILRENKKMRN